MKSILPKFFNRAKEILSGSTCNLKKLRKVGVHFNDSPNSLVITSLPNELINFTAK